MAKITESNKEFAVVRRWLDDEDVVHTQLLVLITQAPVGATVEEIKRIISGFGDSFLDGVGKGEEERHLDWTSGNKVVPSDSWNDDLKQEVALLQSTALRVGEETYGVVYVRDAEGDDSFVLDDEHNCYWRRVTFSGLLDQLTGEKRITLRLPLGLHSALGREAYSRGYNSLNSFCINLLANAVNYEELVEDFEAMRRKPGRPKKVQDAE